MNYDLNCLENHLHTLFEQSHCPDSSVQESIYSEFDEILENEPMFCFACLSILKNSFIKHEIRIISAIVLRRYCHTINPDYIDNFLDSAVGFFMSCVMDIANPIKSQVEALFTSIICIYGDSYFSSIDEQFIMWLNNDRALIFALQTLFDYTKEKKSLSEDVMAALSGIITPEIIPTPMVQYIASIIKNLLLNVDNQPELEKILSIFGDPYFVMFMYSYEGEIYSPALSEIILSFGVLFIRTEEETIGQVLANFIIQYDLYELTDLLEYLSDLKHIPLSEALVISLFCRLEEEDSEICDFNLSSMSMYILNNLGSEYRSKLVDILSIHIQKCENAGQVMRSLSCIIPSLENSSYLFDIIVNHLNDDSRGDAALCLGHILHNHSTLHSTGIDSLIQLINDEEFNVRDKVYFALAHALETITDPKTEWFIYIINSFGNKCEYEKSHLAQIASELLDNMKSLEGQQFEDFFYQLVDSFMSSEESDIPQRYNCILISQMIPKIGFASIQIIEGLLSRSYVLIQQNHSDLFISLCGLIDSIFTTYTSFVCRLDLFWEIINEITSGLKNVNTIVSKEEMIHLFQNVLQYDKESVANHLPVWLDYLISMIPSNASNFALRIYMMIDRNLDQIDSPQLCEFFNQMRSRFLFEKPNEQCLKLFEKIMQKMKERLILDEEKIAIYNSIKFSNENE